MFMSYNLIVGAYALEIGGIPTLISNGIAIYRHDIRKSRPDTDDNSQSPKREEEIPA
jgi:hypothetical protein